MKWIACLFVAACSYGVAAAQSKPAIVFKVPDAPGGAVTVTKPLDGKVFIDFPAADTLNAHGELVLPNTQKKAGPYTFHYKGKIYRLFVKPGKNYKVTVDPGQVQRPVIVEGADAAGQEALGLLQFDNFQGRGMRLYKQDTVFEHNRDKALREIDSCLQPFRQLLAKKAIDQVFYTYTEQMVRNYYASVLTTTLMAPVRALVFHKDSARFDASKLRAVENHWQDVLAISDPRNMATAANDTYFNYWYVINNWYYVYFLEQSRGTYKVSKNDDDAQQAWYNAIDAHVKQEPMREFQVASLLQLMVLEKRYETIIPGLYAAFVKRYPKSVYIPLLEPGIEDVKVFLATHNTDFSPDQQFVEQYAAINTVDDLVARFKGKAVFMDLWATWCGPCKEEFAYSPDLKAMLDKNNIAMLYVSIDRDAVDAQWKNMIKFYKLKGYHVRASKKLNEDIFRLFNKKEILAIPRYVLFKDGKMVLAEAKEPRSKEALYQQLLEALKS
ncbi:TlpA family protein disulfide reductase [Paraflavitalea pollutisoli]|uniref:TlpA family protein disulfide reductase n=1 Tax=Paraflavitalea pollutisoli TaxID=3034143 RepID=UPI0023ED0107|nr:thioredoxin-like domain-containing protein [Paraflavitalea sp. H1-2-19X]